MNIFNQLLEGIFNQQNLIIKESQIEYLQKQQSILTKLASSYRTQTVDVNYLKFQNAYLLRYFPFYTPLLQNLLDELVKEDVWLPDANVCRPVFFGCGPAPEFTGLLNHLRSSLPSVKKIEAQFVDKQAVGWQPSLGINLKYVATPRWRGKQFDHESTVADIGEVNLLHKIKSKSCHLAVFQNCFNEVYDSPGQVVENIKKLAQVMPVGSLIVVIDRSRFRITNHMLQELKSWAMQSELVKMVGDFSLDEQIYSCYSILNTIPKIIRDNFCCLYSDLPSSPKREDRLWFKSRWVYANRVTFVSLALQRCANAPKQ